MIDLFTRPITEEMLSKDISSILFPNNIHRFLWAAFPPMPGLKILEAGCGSGKFGLGYLTYNPSDVTFMDISEQAKIYNLALRNLLSKVKMVYPSNTWVVGDFHNIPFPDNTFDLVFNEQALQYCTNTADAGEVIKEMARVSRDRVIVFVPQDDDGLMGFDPALLTALFMMSGLNNVWVQPTDGGWTDSTLLMGMGSK